MPEKNKNSTDGSPSVASIATVDHATFPSYPSSANASTIVQQDPAYQQTLADPVFSGFGTWLGTIISIIGAIAAWRQAKKAKSFVEKISTEQQRSTISATVIHLNNLENYLLPLWEHPRKRGIKIPQIISDAKYECHRALSDLSEKRDGEIRKAIQSIEAKLEAYLLTKDGEPTVPELNSSVRRELQDVSSVCKYSLEGFAQSE